jgi:hypothetical protein
MNGACGPRIGEAQQQPGPGVHACRDPGQLEGVGEDFVALR